MNVIKVIYRCCVDPKWRFRYFSSMGLYNGWDDKKYLERLFENEVGYKLNLDNPTTFNEKLQWLKLYNRRPEYTIMVDKYAVREYISGTIGEQYLVPLLGAWDDPDQIDFNSLPNKFVLKCNHNSGLGMYICRDKLSMNVNRVKKELRLGLKQDYYLQRREWPYKNVPRKIICEQYLEDKPGERELRDYKVLCFNGIPKLIELHQGRFTKMHTQDFYDTIWKKLDIKQVDETNSKIAADRPVELDKMLELSSILAKGIPHVRVDWYYTSGKLYFGELTFFDGSGLVAFTDAEDDKLLGSWITLPPMYVNNN